MNYNRLASILAAGMLAGCENDESNLNNECFSFEEFENGEGYANEISKETGIDYAEYQKAICEIAKSLDEWAQGLDGVYTDETRFQTVLYEMASQGINEYEFEGDEGYLETFYIECFDYENLSGNSGCFYNFNIDNEKKDYNAYWRLTSLCESNNTFQTGATYYLADGSQYESASGDQPCSFEQ